MPQKYQSENLSRYISISKCVPDKFQLKVLSNFIQTPQLYLILLQLIKFYTDTKIDFVFLILLELINNFHISSYKKIIDYKSDIEIFLNLTKDIEFEYLKV